MENTSFRLLPCVAAAYPGLPRASRFGTSGQVRSCVHTTTLPHCTKSFEQTNLLRWRWRGAGTAKTKIAKTLLILCTAFELLSRTLRIDTLIT